MPQPNLVVKNKSIKKHQHNVKGLQFFYSLIKQLGTKMKVIHVLKIRMCIVEYREYLVSARLYRDTYRIATSSKIHSPRKRIQM